MVAAKANHCLQFEAALATRICSAALISNDSISTDAQKSLDVARSPFTLPYGRAVDEFPRLYFRQ